MQDIDDVDAEIRAALDRRYYSWCDRLATHGFHLERPDPSWLPAEFRLRATYPEAQGHTGFGLSVAIREQVLEGPDPERVRGLPDLGTCHLYQCSWHAEFSGDVEPGVSLHQRVDVDRSKPLRLRIHEHPFGTDLDLRVPVVPLPSRWDWLTAVVSNHWDRR
jgi:hypothetical protein